MSSLIKRFFVFFSSLFLIAVFGTNSFGAEAIAKKNLKRSVDPVIMDGKLASEVIGSPLDGLHLFSFHDGKFEPIRFQVDEMTGENGDWILNAGPIPNNDLSNGKFDSWDKLLFMAEDTGDRVSKEAWLPGYTRGSEIEVDDPLTGEKGWCYLFYFSSNSPPLSNLPDYVKYDYKTESIEGDSYYYQYIITKNGLHSTYYKVMSLKGKNGIGKNFVDRLKVRPTLKIIGALPIHFDEENLKSNVIAYKTGPVRAIRRVEQYVQIAWMKSLRAVVDVMYYADVVTVPMMVTIPLRPSALGSSLVVRFGTDYNPNAFSDMYAYNSSNPKGFLINGKMDEAKKNFNPEFDSWRLVRGEQMGGAFMTRTIINPKLRNLLKLKMGLIDDNTRKDPPENYPGLYGFMWQDWDISDVPKGKYCFCFLEFYGISPYRQGDEISYCNYMDHLLKIRSGNQECINRATLLPELGDRYKK
ncbi:MAG: hypothetical protein APR62_04125 [Smithella sp. SDB]|nr:MAG: hypothetical protein APR62_04125 [Smithella sp. SDB]